MVFETRSGIGESWWIGALWRNSLTVSEEGLSTNMVLFVSSERWSKDGYLSTKWAFPLARVLGGGEWWITLRSNYLLVCSGMVTFLV